MKWFFCWCQDTEFRADHDWKNLIRAAVQSARTHTSLEPNLIYDGENSAFIEELAAQGVNIIFHRVSLTRQILRHFADDAASQAVARGAFLRFDIPLVCDTSDGFVLYTDADVMFRATPDFRGYAPGLIAAAPEMHRGDRLDMNSGVMLLNVKNFKDFHETLIRFTASHMHLGLDQEILRALLRSEYLLLPDLYNWKPYWGENAQAPIVHWHGPKPVTVASLLGGATETHGNWRALFERAAPSYGSFLSEYAGLLADYTKRRVVPISRGKPARQSSHYQAADGTRPFSPEAAVDGACTGSRKCHTAFQERPWWEVDLGGIARITEIRVHNTTDATAPRCRRLSLAVSIDGSAWAELIRKEDDTQVGNGVDALIWSGPGPAFGRFVRVTLLEPNYLHLAQVEVFGRMS